MTKRSILVVDDDVASVTFLAELVADEGWSASVAANASQALDALGREKFDLLLTDIRMPGMDGIDLIEQVRRSDERIAVVAITAFGSLQTGLRALRSGATAYVSKPFDLAELREKLHHALAERDRLLETDRIREENEKLRSAVRDMLTRPRRK